MVSCLIFRSLNHFEFIFVNGLRECSNCINLHVASCPAFPVPLVEETVFSPLYILTSFVIDKLTVGTWVYCWALYSVLLIYMSVFCANTMLF